MEPMQIAEWLDKLGLAQYAQRFAQNGIDIGVLPELMDEDFEKLGVLLGHRRKMLRAIADLDPAALIASPAPPQDAERRHLTVMFCDLVGSTALSARLDPEDMWEVIRAYRAACASVVGAYDGRIARFVGDGILVYFGYPRAHEDDAERAVRAGLDMIAAIRQLKTGTDERAELRIAIATGLVVVGDLISGDASEEHATIGDTPNLAARLQSLAEPGVVVVASSTRRLLGDLFSLRNLGRREVKGMADPIAVWAVEGATASESRFEAVRAARSIGFVGRKSEIEFILSRQREAWQGRGQIVLISGEAGIGKSRIVATLSESPSLGTHRRVRYQCSPYHTNSALHPFVAQLERAAGIRSHDTPDQKLDKLEAMLAIGTQQVARATPLIAALLSIPTGDHCPPLGLSPAQQRRQTFAALLDQLEGLARDQPLLIICEDMHWADATTLELFDLAVDRIRGLPILVLLTSRPEFEPSWSGLANVSLLRLDRLDRQDTRALVEQIVVGRQLPREMMEQIIDKTDGIPLFVEELTKMVLESGLLVEDAGRYRLNCPLPPLAIPATLQDSLMARLDRLAPVKEVAQIGAAIGRDFSYALLKTVAGRDDLTLGAALGQLEEAELLLRRGTPPEANYSFKHALVQEAAYESLLRSKRQVLHTRIGDVLREKFPVVAETEPEVLAHHFTEAGLSEIALEWWRKAGQQALKRSAYSEAIAHLGKAIAIADQLPDEPRRMMSRLHLQIAYGRALRGSLGHSAPETVAAWTRARQFAAGIDDPVELAPVHSGLFNACLTHGELAPMRELADAIRSAAERRPDSPVAAVVAHWTGGVTCWFAGGYSNARTHLERALAIYRAEPDPATFRASALDLPFVIMRFLALVLWPLGDIARARRLAAEAVGTPGEKRALSQANALVHRAVFDGVCGGMLQQTETILALGLARDHTMPLYVAAGTYLNGLAKWRAGDRMAGLADMRHGWTFLHENDCYLCEPFWGMHVALAIADVGEVETGLEILDELIAGTGQSGQHWLDAELHRVRGKLLSRENPSDESSAEDALRRALEIARHQQTRTFELRSALELARLYKTNGRAGALSEVLAPVLAEFEAEHGLPEFAEAKALLGNGR
ncbi:adenylate/guanylate cyclase domain-containing protein [Bradyrhizobium sp. WBAH42]|nr:adenylate/guanylate cyclase domain-containing protein [Bradyrhizobium sp. WBAH30]MDD1544280.1 adenylate/guanylate cyclase domain-containing protein [Bradyrhizobium sp. WBAH41]MDD1558162.1 adenylate/guanylate cyclase domain-containing protein [Bradyrhizobium sp. WBAH23]MDD1565560.1 adenylate/guanylate cyclase domain-containing protein [Bradyrhizobium sp. WBAH33]MDD1590690.1 adenylate/guanylate cyclase domain-containing protein [Bradyrhizobium sp. WBAH42]NRB89238.1 adenylate/guanylate cyclase